MAPVFDYNGSLRRMGNDVSLFHEMVDLFKEDAPKYLAEIQHSAATADYVSLKRAAHTLKGLVLNFGATRATSAAMTLELVAQSAATDSIERNNILPAREELADAIQELLRALDQPTAECDARGTDRVSRSGSSKSFKH